MPGTGNGEPESGNECTAVTRLRNQNGRQEKRKALGNREFLPAVAPDDQYILVRAECYWHWDKQSMSWRLRRQSNRMSSASAKQSFQPGKTSIPLTSFAAKKKCSPAIETWQVAGLDIISVAPRKFLIDFHHECRNINQSRNNSPTPPL